MIVGLLVLSGLLPLAAQQLPLHFVEADSVVTWSYGGRDFSNVARQAVGGVKPLSLRLAADAMKHVDEVGEVWRTFQPQLNVAGGGGDLMTDGQGVPASYGFNLNALMLLLTAQSAHADGMERSLFNAAHRALADSVTGTSEADRRAAAEVLMSAAGTIYALSADEADLFVNLYANSTARLSSQGRRFTLDQITEMPADGRVKFRLMNVAGSMPLRIHLRIPDWASKRRVPLAAYCYADTVPCLPRIFVNGHEVERTVPDEAGYVVIDRAWRSLDEIYIDFRLPVQYVRPADGLSGAAHGGALALQVGPLVYAVTTDVGGHGLSPKTRPKATGRLNAQGHEQLSGRLGLESETSLPFVAEPYADGVRGTVWIAEELHSQ